MPFNDNSIYNPPKAGWKVLVMRRWPRGVRKNKIDEWFPDAAPSFRLLKSYQNEEIDFDELAWRYESEIRENPRVLDHFHDLEREHGTVILLCWERPPRRCHREVLLRLLES